MLLVVDGSAGHPILFLIVEDRTTLTAVAANSTGKTRARVGASYGRATPDLRFPQWSDKAIERTTPALLGLYSLITLWAGDLLRQGAVPYAAAWYRKSAFTFTDAIAAVRRQIWIGDITDTSPHHRDVHKIPPDRLIRMADALCFAA